MLWVVKGYIAQVKGYNVNWARTASSTTKKKARRLLTEKMKSTKSIDMSKLSGGLEVSCKTEGGDVCKSFIVVTRSTNRLTCPYGVSAIHITMVQDLHCIFGELFKSLGQKLAMLEGEATNLTPIFPCRCKNPYHPC
jgi:hypothetical protein